MPTLSEQLSLDMANAMRAGQTRKRDVIRYLRAAIKNAEIERQRQLTDDEIRDVIRTQIKQRRDSIDLFRKGGREDLASSEEAQIAILEPYLPAQLDNAELEDIVVNVANDIEASTMKDMGRLISAVRSEVGERAEGRRVSEMVKSVLARREAEA